MIDCEYDYFFQLVMLGDSGVGKTNLVSRFVSNRFTAGSVSTTGLSATPHSANFGESIVRLSIHDTANPNRRGALKSQFYWFAKGALAVYDISDRESYSNIPNKLEELRKELRLGSSFPITLIGNKCDLADKRVVSVAEAQKFADENGLMFEETSAFDGSNVTKVFRDIITRMIEKKEMTDRMHGRGVVVKEEVVEKVETVEKEGVAEEGAFAKGETIKKEEAAEEEVVEKDEAVEKDEEIEKEEWEMCSGAEVEMNQDAKVPKTLGALSSPASVLQQEKAALLESLSRLSATLSRTEAATYGISSITRSSIDDTELDFPRVSEWLQSLDNSKRGRDGQNFAQYAKALEVAGYLRIDSLDNPVHVTSQKIINLTGMLPGYADNILKWVVIDIAKLRKASRFN
ncbi:hypothetical protein BOTBODRAFT_34061 [Botryobasidium botryosum FD-172 SS1]|uniref:Uncharacterized protein n=1 Tax=Botryobasidium botryosum (strain FD-172 SS1) TaxID=930990 RepID=A0A067MAY8_BOTB1|nr:hypothetical protein BOTBODRAFT_34061 [Botryobasidium botryosum FD-172 SS1]